MSPINYSRHFAYLAIAVVALVLVESSSLTLWLDRFRSSYALFGALHALALVAALRAGSIGRRIIFVVVTGALSASVPYAGIALPSALGLDGGFAFFGAFAFGSAIGALGYWMLVRAFWLPNMDLSDALFSVSLCVGATALGLFLSAVLSGFGAHHSALTDAPLTVLWWYAFSYSLWKSQGSAMAANNRWRGP